MSKSFIYKKYHISILNIFNKLSTQKVNKI
nr:MAG TPA: hypothetical protein [Caudoviricetes sp.]